MAQIPGTNVSAMVVPFDTQDIYATHNDKYGRGGFRVLDTLADRDDITTPRRKAGMWVKVLETGKVYELDANETSWTEVTFSGGTGGSYTLPAATRSTLGGIKVGSGLSITSDGVLSVDISCNKTSRSDILAGTIEDIDQLGLASIIAIKWAVTVINPTTQQVRSFEVSANVSDSGDIYYVIGSIFGDNLDVLVSVESQNGSIALKVANNTQHAIEVSSSRTTVHPRTIQTCEATPIVSNSVSPLADLHLDTINMSEGRAVKWMVSISDPTLETIRTYDVSAHHSYGILAQGGNVNYTIATVFGDCTSANVSVVSDNGFMKLQVTSLVGHLINVTSSIISFHPL